MKSTEKTRGVLAGMFLVLALGVIATAQSLRSGAVYAMTNRPTGNEVVAFHRAPDGSLSLRGVFSTGGLGSGGFDQSQNALVLSGRPGADVAQDSNQLLFAVNAGSNEVSVFAVGNDGLTLVSKVSSGGERPNSLTVHNNLLYVLNAGPLPLAQGGIANISGFTISNRGELAPIPDSTRLLSGNPFAGAADVEFDPTGKVLLVSERNANVIDAFTVNGDGTTTGPIPNTANSVAPFGFSFTGRHGIPQLITADGFGAGPAQGRASSYNVSNDGTLTPVGVAVANGQTDTCWVAITNNDHFVYVSNFQTDDVSSYSLASDGTLSLLNPVAGTTDPGGRANDEATSLGSRYLYVRNFTTGTISAFRIENDGSLTPIPGANVGSPLTGYGLAAR